MRLQKRIRVLGENLTLGAWSWIAGVKYAVATLGIGSEKPVSPLLQSLDKQQQDRMNDFLQQYPRQRPQVI
jgi:hypothetical protein